MRRGELVTVALQGDLGKPFGRIEDEAMLRVNRALAVWIGLA